MGLLKKNAEQFTPVVTSSVSVSSSGSGTASSSASHMTTEELEKVGYNYSWCVVSITAYCWI